MIDAIRGPTGFHVADLADTHVRALKYLLSGDTICALNLTDARGYSVMDVIETARRVCEKTIRNKMAPRRPGDPPSLIADARNWMQKNKNKA